MPEQEVTDELLAKMYNSSKNISYRDLEKLTGISKSTIQSRVKSTEVD